MNQTEKMEMQIAENQDGSAVVQLPPGAEPQELAASPVEDDQDDEQEESSASAAVDADPEREAIRQARREERQLKKQLHKEKTRESRHLINALRKQNMEMAERLAQLERRTSGAEIARVDKAIDDAAVRVEFAKMKMSEALSSQNGAEHAKAQEAWFEARRQLEALQSLKQTVAKQAQQPRQNIPDPTVQKMAADWMERNPWYDPQGKNVESAIAQKIDKQLHDDGYDPTSEEYWEELDARIKKYVPASQTQVYNDSNGRSERRRSTMTSSGRDSMATAKPGEFILSSARVNAIKEAGWWDNPQLRQKAIDKYREWDRQNKAQRN